MLEVYVKNGVPLNDVHDSAANLTVKIKDKNARVRALKAFEKRTMYMKLVDARKHLANSEKALKRKKFEMQKVVRKDTFVWNELMKVVKEDTEELWKFESEKAKVKFQRAKLKEKKIDLHKNSIIEGVAVGNEELEKYRNNENHTDVKTYGGVAISEAEKDLLSLPPNHMIYPKINLDQIEVEIEKSCVKAEYEKIRMQKEKEEKAKKSENYDNVTLANDEKAKIFCSQKV